MLKKLFAHFEEVTGAITLFIMVTITFVNVVTRYVIVYPLSFTEEITVNLFVWLVMAGTSLAFRQNANLAMTFVYTHLPKGARKFCFIFSALLTVVFFGLLTWLGTLQVLDEIELGSVTESLAIPSAIYSAAVPLFSVVILIRFSQSIREFVAKGSY